MKTVTGLCVIFACVAGGVVHADTCKIVEEVKASVKSGWRQLEKCSDKIAALREEPRPVQFAPTA